MTAPVLRVADLVAGYVIGYHPDRALLELRTSAGQLVEARCRSDVPAEFVRNLGEPPVWRDRDLRDLLTPERHLFAHGILTTEDGRSSFEVKNLVLTGPAAGRYAFDPPGWWPDQLAELAKFYRDAQFGTDEPDFTRYRTMLRLDGNKIDFHVQEADAISRLVYGMASAFLLTGEEDHLEVARRGTEYLRTHMRFADQDTETVYWYHGIDLRDGVESKLFTSEFSDDYRAVPAYEQIYALTGPTQTYRITGDPLIAADIGATMRLFERFFHDDVLGGYYSHIDPITLDPHSASLGPNQSRKNWNSIGDHAPAYLFNLYLATGDTRHVAMLEECFDLIVRHFPDPENPFVNERFHADWSIDRTWGWQQDRAVIGHNLKIAWNLMRMNALRPKRAYRELADRIGRTMPAVAGDVHRGGWYDVMERELDDGTRAHRLTWHDRKAWWQQEQAILAYLILAGNTGDEFFLRQAKESAAFYNAFFLDHDSGGVYFNVLADGVPYLLGTERLKGSHAMSMYHSAELCLLATVYQRLLLRDEPLDLWFRPMASGFADRVLRVAPDVLPPGRVRLERVEIDGDPHAAFDPTDMTVKLPETAADLTVRARIVPT